jgi:hypothetical protein
MGSLDALSAAIRLWEDLDSLQPTSHNFAMPDIGPPPFPEDVPTVPLVVIDYELIKERDATEIDKLWGAATHLGFW